MSDGPKASPGELELEAAWTRERVRGGLFGQAGPVMIGRYELGELLGSGGMGVVFAAHDPMLARHVAVKVVRAGVTDAHRLLREGRALARLSHPNVVRVLDAGTDRTRTFLVLERVRGQTLEQWREVQPRSDDEVIAVMLAAGSGLAAAHELGLVHRDVKPRNILIDGDGVARLSDFGLVRPHEGEAEPAENQDAPRRSAPAESHATSAHALVGTMAYMAPEQLARAETDVRTDQFAYCATLYEALFGARPFLGASPAELLSAIARGVPDAAKARAHWIHDVLAKGLSAAPDERYPSMHALLDAVRSRRDSREHVASALLAVERLGRAYEEGEDLEELFRRAKATGDEARRAREAWPTNPDAARAEQAVQELLATLEAARSAAVARDRDPRLGDQYKAVWTLVVALTWSGVYVALGSAQRRGTFEAGNGTLLVFYAVFLGIHVIMGLSTEREWRAATDAARRMTHVTTTTFVFHTFIALLALGADLDVAVTLAVTQVMAAALWTTAAITFDRRVFAIVPFTVAAAVVCSLVPAWAFFAVAAARALGVGALALLYRMGDERPMFERRRATKRS